MGLKIDLDYKAVLAFKSVKVFFILLVLCGATLFAEAFKFLGFHESNIIMLYLLGVLIVAYVLEGFFYGILASLLGVLTFNFFFTEPYYSLLAYRPDYPVTFAMMLFASVLMSTLTNKVKQEAKLSKIREKRAFVLYKMSQGLLEAQSIPEICNVVGIEVSAVLKVIVQLNIRTELWSEEVIYENGIAIREGIFIAEGQRALINQVYKTKSATRYSKKYFDDYNFYYAPIQVQSEILGVFGISLKHNEIMYEEKLTLIEAMTYQIGLALERVIISDEKKRKQLEMERERFRANLLRAISHDLRTPLTGILGATSTLKDHSNQITEDQRKSLLEDIAQDTQWLIQSVENILSMTKFDEGKVTLNIKSELVDDLILEALNRFKNRDHRHQIHVNLPEELIAIYVDGNLIEQVIVNLIDNAIKYTPENSQIIIDVKPQVGQVFFLVSDEGKGIDESHIPLLFNRFFRAEFNSDKGKNGIGLGLEICKSIVEAHGGQIRAFNNSNGGATFEFSLPVGGYLNAE